MDWYKDWFGEEYLLVYEHRDEAEAIREVEAIRKILGLKGHELVLDLACGTGRHALPLAQADLRVIGLDYSSTLLAIAHESVPAEYTFPRYVRGDAKSLPFGKDVFDVVLSLFTSFGYFSDDDNRSVLEGISRILKPGGYFYIDYLNPERIEAGLVPESTRENDGLRIVERRSLNHDNKRVEKTIELHRDSEVHTFCESVRLYSHEEFRGMLESAGLTTDGIIGSIDMSPYTMDSDRMILYGHKRRGTS